MIDRIIELVNRGYEVRFIPGAFPKEMDIRLSKDVYQYQIAVVMDVPQKYHDTINDRVMWSLLELERQIEARLMEKNGLLIKVTDHYGIVYIDDPMIGLAYHIRRLDDPENSITARRHKGEAERECKYLEALNYGVVREPVSDKIEK